MTPTPTQVQIVVQNAETGVTATRSMLADAEPQKMRESLIKELGELVGTIAATVTKGDSKLTYPIGTVHQQDVPYPQSDRLFTRTSFAFVSTAVAAMSPDARVAYLRAVLPEPTAKPTREVTSPDAPAPKPPARAKAKRADAMPVNPKKRR